MHKLSDSGIYEKLVRDSGSRPPPPPPPPPSRPCVQSALNIAKELTVPKKAGSKKLKCVVPTLDQVDEIINSSEAIVQTLEKIVDFADEKKKEFPPLETLPIKQSDVEKLFSDLEAVKTLPYD